MKSKFVLVFVVCVLLFALIFGLIYAGAVLAFTKPDSVLRATLVTYGMTKQQVDAIAGEGRHWSSSNYLWRYSFGGYALVVGYTGYLGPIDWIAFFRVERSDDTLSGEVFTDARILLELPKIVVLVMAVGCAMVAVLLIKGKQMNERTYSAKKIKKQ